MVSSETARIGILTRAKYPSPPQTAYYGPAKSVVSQYLCDKHRDISHIVDAENQFLEVLETPGENQWERARAQHSIAVLHALQGMANQLSPYQFYQVAQHQAKLVFSGVEISIYVDLLVTGFIRGKRRSGAAILRLTKRASSSEKESRKTMGLYVATLCRTHLEQNMDLEFSMHNDLIMAIDVQLGEVFTAPRAYKKRVGEIENACRFISAIWPTLPASEYQPSKTELEADVSLPGSPERLAKAVVAGGALRRK